MKNCDTFVSLKRGTLHFVCLSRDNAAILFDTALNDPYLVMVSNPADLSRLFFLCVSFSNWAMPSMRARFSASHCSNRQYWIRRSQGGMEGNISIARVVQ